MIAERMVGNLPTVTLCAGCGLTIDPEQLAVGSDGSLCESCEEQLAAPESSWRPKEKQ